MKHRRCHQIFRSLLLICCVNLAVHSTASLPGDLNHDDIVNGKDFAVVFKAYNHCLESPLFNTEADFVVDGCVDINDIREFFKWVGTSEVYAELVQLGDKPFELGSTDYIQLYFTVPPSELSFSDISLNVKGDTFGDSAKQNAGDHVRFDWPYGGNQNIARIYLGSNVVLRQGGIANSSQTGKGSPSGINIEGYGLKDLGDYRVRRLQRSFDNYYKTYRPKVIERVNGGDSCLDFYALSYDIDGLLAMYEATRSTFYLKEAMTLVDTMLSFTKDQDADGYLDFQAKTKTLNDFNSTYNVALCDWKAARPVGKLYRLLQQNPSFTSRYKIHFKKIQSFVELDIVQKWSELLHNQSSSTYFPTGVSHVENDNLIHRIGHYGEVVSYAWLATQNSKYKDVLESVVSRTCSDFVENTRHDGTVEWDIFINRPGKRPKINRLYGAPYTGISDTSHANGVVSFLVIAQLEANTPCEDHDTLKKLINTFTKVITVPPDSEKKTGYRFADFVDGGVLNDGQRPFSMGRFIEDGWLNLGEIDSEVQRIGQEFYDQGEVVHRLQYTGNLIRNYALNQWQ